MTKAVFDILQTEGASRGAEHAVSLCMHDGLPLLPEQVCPETSHPHLHSKSRSTGSIDMAVLLLQ